MAKIQHLYSTTSGHVPASLLRGQLAINLADQLVYANDPLGRVQVISSGVAGVGNAASLLGVHIPIGLYPVAQFGPTLSQTDLQARFVDNGTTAVLQTVPIFVFGRLWYTPVLSCPSLPSSPAYSLTLNPATRTVTMQSVPTGTTRSTSGSVNYQGGTATLVFYSDGTIYPWFYLPQAFGNSIANGGDVPLYRISPVKTFAAVPVSAGFAGAAATSYWGAT